MRRYCKSIEKITTELQERAISEGAYSKEIELTRSINSSHEQELEKKNREIRDYAKKLKELEAELER
jgi:uncharacterized protein (DUF3084 family)